VNGILDVVSEYWKFESEWDSWGEAMPNTVPTFTKNPLITEFRISL